jgi:sugar fermentation stimulation protein A
MRFFSNDREALFVRRPNRFLIIARDGDEEIPCHCPNPGRLIEFIFPGTPLILEKRRPGLLSAKTQWTAAGLYYRDAAVPLFAARANQAAKDLVLKEIIPDLRSIQGEFTLGDSRFDFLCIDGAGRRHLVEVKSCSLIEYGVAMFPDAPSSRAVKHIQELAALTSQGYSCHVLFVLVHSMAERFVPNLHTDPAFASALSRFGWAGQGSCPQDKVAVHAAQVKCDSQGTTVLVNPQVPADLSQGALAGKNSGSYLVALELRDSRTIEVGSLGTIDFQAGWYVYAGSAQKNLSQRMNRHLRKVRKAKHWHLDYLTAYAGSIKALPVMSYRNLECGFADALAGLGGAGVPGFGCSDCRCRSHLYYFPGPPMKNRDFVEKLLWFRHIEGLQHKSEQE